MTDSPLIPGSHSRPIAPTGQFAGEWYRFFRDLIRYVQETEGNSAELAALEARVAALEAAGQNPLTLLGPFSVQVLGSLLDGSATVQLVNDEGDPGAWRFYATDESGGKAWLPLYPNVVPNPYADYLIDPDGNYLTDHDGNFLMSQDGFPIPLEYGGTGADNSSVAANLVWASPDGMAGAPVFRALVGDDLPVPLPDLVAGGTTGQFWRGDGTWSNLLEARITAYGGRSRFAPSNETYAIQLSYNSTRLLAGESVYVGASNSATPDIIFSNSGGSERARFTHDGNFGFGTASPSNFGAGLPSLTLSGTTASFLQATETTSSVICEVAADSGGGGRGVLGTRSNHPFLLKSNNLSKWSISVAGDLTPFADNTYTLGSGSFRISSTHTKDLILGLQAASLGGGVGVAFISNASTVPTSNPANGGILYVSGGALFYRGSAGTVTPLAPA